MAVTIRDVAKAAGTSISTVSKVINRHYSISEATAAREPSSECLRLPTPSDTPNTVASPQRAERKASWQGSPVSMWSMPRA